MASSMQKQTLINVITGLLTVFVQFAVSFFLSPFIVKHLGAEANGFAQLANNFVMYASLITLAFNSMASRFVSVNYHQGQIDKAREYFSSVLVANLVIGTLLLPIALYIVFNLQRVVVIENANALDVKVLFGCVFLNFYLGLWSSLYTMSMTVKNAIYYNNVINTIKSITNAVLLLVVFSILPVKIFYVSAVASLLSLLILPIYRNLQYKLLPEIKLTTKYFNYRAVKELLKAGIWNTINQCGHMLMTGLDLLLANWFISPALMGVLAISKTIPSAIIQLATTINNNFAPSVIISWAKGNKDDTMRQLRTSMKISSILVCMPIVTFCCFGNEFYTLWMPSENAKTLTILSFLACMQFIPVAGTQTLFNVFTAANKLQVNSISFIISGCLNVLVVYLYLIHDATYGIYIIAGVSSTIVILRSMLVVLPYIAHILELKWHTFYKDVVVSLLCAGINAFVAYSIIVSIPFTGWVWLLVKIATTCIVTFIIELIILLSSHERYILLSQIKKIINNHGKNKKDSSV